MKSKQFGIGILIAAVVIALLAALTNPDQASHLRAIKEIGAIQKPAWLPTELSSNIQYNNYFIFSTTTAMGGGLMFTYGYLGQVHTTQYANIASH